MNKQKRADLLLVMVTFFWGASYYLTNLCLTDLQPMNLNAFRFLSAFAVLGVVFRKRLRRISLRPMGTSQYAAMRRGGADLTAALWIFLALAVGLPIWLAGSFAPLAAAVGYGLAAWYGFRQLDGMSGDISGFALTVGELVGAATLLYVG